MVKLPVLHRREREDTAVTPYDLFIIAATVLSLTNLILYLLIDSEALLATINTIDLVLSGLFLFDFIRTLFKRERKLHYFFADYGWADLLASLPYVQFKILRIFRLIKIVRIINRTGLRGVQRGIEEYPALSALLGMVFFVILLTEFGSIIMLALESGAPNANITTIGDSMWWLWVTIATVGYGDTYPVTSGGRLFAVFVMVVGVGLFGVTTGYLANSFIASRKKKRAEHLEVDDEKKIHTSKENADAAVIMKLQKDIDEIKILLKKKQ